MPLTYTPYAPLTWYPGRTGTEFTSARVNHIETGVAAAITPVLFAAAANPDLLVIGTITRDSGGAATAATIVWPDGTSGTYTGTASGSFPGAIDSYVLTHGSTTFTQPTVTRDSTGAVTVRPQIVVT